MNATTHEELEELFQVTLPMRLWENVCHCESKGLEDYVRSVAKRHVGETSNCADCGQSLHIWKYDPVKALVEFQSFGHDRIHNDDESLWHMTSIPGWEMKYGVEFHDFHCGDQVTAWSRGFDVVKEKKFPTRFLHEYPFYLYELKKSKHFIRGEYTEDMGQDWDFAEKNFAYPYINAHEFPGSHSFYGHTSAFDIVGLTEVFLPDMFEKMIEILD